MAETHATNTVGSTCFKEAVCIDAGRIYDSCSDKDCLENLQVFFTDCGQNIIDQAVNVKCRNVEILNVYLDVESVPFNKGFYGVDITFFFLVELGAYTGPMNQSTPVRGVATFSKKVILYGSEGNVRVYTSEDLKGCRKHHSTNLPTASIQATDYKPKGGCKVEEMNVLLTPADKVVLASYSTFMEGLGAYLGDGYELVLHSLENVDKSVIKILNGYHTGRKVGAPVTDLALSMLAAIQKMDKASSVSYFTKNKKGEPLKATTIPIEGENNRIIGLLCINFYLNTPYLNVVSNFFPHLQGDTPMVSENFSENIEDLVQRAVEEARKDVQDNCAIPANCKNKEIITLLQGKGIFNMKDAVVVTANMLGISKNTVYMHLRNLSGQAADA